MVHVCVFSQFVYNLQYSEQSSYIIPVGQSIVMPLLALFFKSYFIGPIDSRSIFQSQLLSCDANMSYLNIQWSAVE